MPIFGKNPDVSSSLAGQFIRSGTSIGANLEEAQSCESRPDFISKNAIALKQARETNYWLRLISGTNKFEENIEKGIIDLISESEEIKRNKENHRFHHRFSKKRKLT